MSNKSSSYDSKTEEINITELFFTLWHNKFTIIKFGLVGAISMFILNFFLPKVYLSEASFFLKADNLSSNSLGSYSSLLGDMNSALENQIEEIIKSKSMEFFLVQETEKTFPDFFEPDSSIGGKIGQLKLEKKLSISKNKRSLLTLQYSANSPELCFFIVNKVLTQINVFNELLELSEQSQIITLLDHPQVPTMPSSPKKLLNILVAGILFSLLGTFFIILKDYQKEKL